MKNFLLITLILISIQSLKSTEFYLDAISFKSNDLDSVGRCDIFVVVPYSLLKFENNNDIFYASYNLIYKVFDADYNLIFEDNQKTNLKADDYFQAQGGDGKFKTNSKSFNLKPGNFTIEVTMQDNLANIIYKKKRNLNILEFNEFPFALSGIMLLSAIEENNKRFKITPFFDDNIATIKNGFFAFFEIYRNNNIEKKYKFFYQLINENEKDIITGELISHNLTNIKEQFYLHIKSDKFLIGKYTLRVIAVENETEGIPDKKDYLAITQRVVNFTPSLIISLLENIDDSIKKLRYVASTSQINLMKEAETKDKKIDLFIKFWEELDPTPNTEKNEALIEYFARIEYANNNFKAYTDGWLTDKGNVYIIYGKPLSITTSNSSYESRITYEQWLYDGNREFVFQDKSGLGDFRLVRPFSIMDVYKYRSN